jgi:hypothetical protein
MAVHRVIAWYREGVDVQARLPLLATYLGHVAQFIVGCKSVTTS